MLKRKTNAKSEVASPKKYDVACLFIVIPPSFPPGCCLALAIQGIIRHPGHFAKGNVEGYQQPPATGEEIALSPSAPAAVALVGPRFNVAAGRTDRRWCRFAAACC